MPHRKKADDHEIPDLTELEAENIIVRKKKKDHEKPILTGSEPGNKDLQPEK